MYDDLAASPILKIINYHTSDQVSNTDLCDFCSVVQFFQK